MEKQINFKVSNKQIVGMLHLPKNKDKVPKETPKRTVSEILKN